jgi:hypothetical protein
MTFVYSGCSYKPQWNINNYMHDDFVASVAANLTILSSENSRLEDTNYILKLDMWLYDL